MLGLILDLMESLLRFPFWTSTFCLYLSWTQVQGNYQLIGSSEPIIAAPGDDVILPCRVDPDWNAREKTVEWSRPDLKASGPQKRVEYVYVHRFRKMDRDMMMETYIQRTSLSEGLRHGDVSLRIHNVSLEDNGRFRCFIPNLSIEAEVLLVVDPDFVKMTTAETVPQRTSPAPEEETIRTGRRNRLLLCLPAAVFFFFFLVGFLCYFRKFPKNSKFCPLQQICVHADRNSAERDSNQQLNPPGEDLHPLPQSDSGQSVLFSLRKS
ncbi:myelin-oligodendrocyte glycoprotein-like isoform X2 [Cyprinodon tularosa]|uniref:myelin-oligodendrocyte glycoprotein-like isoform X2 n=1 Tax=Cyprinodon tularosa TaxID=77115 RepID=UPI0018E2475F|nr:myelin-oligodendrocyte glycoprotein-like isoform X2 [Cyprinodon tularosa]